MERFTAAALAGLTLLAAGLSARQPDPRACAPDGASCPGTCKVCVAEPKQNKKVVYGSKWEEYCLPHCSLLRWLTGKCGCEDGPCGKVKVRHRLVIKKVDGPCAKQCVLKEVPATSPPPCPDNECPPR